MTEIQEIKEHLRPINIASVSFGKDSTATLQLVLEAMKGTGTKLYIVTSDTKMEIPFYEDYLNRQREKVQRYISENGINAEMVMVYPEPHKTYWILTLGLGYPAPHQGFRWCTGAIKTEPMEAAAAKITQGTDYMTFIGVRRAESALREKIYTSKNVDEHQYAPILDWSTEDVWTYLLTEPCPWGDHQELVKVYRYSYEECVYGAKQGVCIGNARYGCWICPLQKEAQLNMLTYFTGDKRYLALKQYKEVYCSMSNNTAYRSRIRRNGEEGAGPFLVTVREDLYRDLKKLEARTGWQLITPDEEAQIFKHWEEDRDIHNVACNDWPILFPVETER